MNLKLSAARLGLRRVVLGASLLGALLPAGCALSQDAPRATGAGQAAAQPAFTAYADGRGEVVLLRGGEEYLRFGWTMWGPGWAWTWLDGEVKAQGGVASGELSGKLGGTQAPVKVSVRAEKSGPRALKITYSTRVEADTALTLITALMTPGKAFEGREAKVTSRGGEASVAVPFAMRGLGEKVSRVQLSDAAGRALSVNLEPALDIASDNSARVVLAKDSLAANTTRSVTFTVQLPGDVAWYAGASEIPDEPGASTWYPWSATGSGEGSVLGLEGWGREPAGRFGRVSSKGAALVYNGAPIRLWGLNLSFAATAPEKALADKRAALYKRYGINAVRMHKWADGSGWAGILREGSATELDPEALDRFDYQAAKLKEAGVFLNLSANFGTLKLGQKERAAIPWAAELGDERDGRTETPHSAIHYSPELQDIQIAQTLALLKHKNPYTGLTYAQDPAVSFVEAINEQSILFWSSMEPLKKSATLRKQVGKRFSDWLRAKYLSQDALDRAWGEGGMDSMAGELRSEGGESLARGNILPMGNPWFWDPEQLEGSQKPKRQRLLDTLQFLTMLQDEFFARYAKAVREAGYGGELLGSNWQAGRALSHFANLHSDAQVGAIDRHNYFGGAANATMISRAGSGLLSSGMQQVEGKPFMLSEWIHTFPNEYALEGPAIIGAYGMGLQGWDASYMFQNGDEGTFSTKLGRSEWDVAAPQVLGVFPAVARQILRGDVAESSVVAARNVHFPSLFEGKLGFDDKVVQGYDQKELDSSKVPARALAVARSVVDFTPKYVETPAFSLAPYEKGGALISSTKQLSWTEAPQGRADAGFFTIDTPATKAVVGFAQGQKLALGRATIEPASRYGAVYVTVRGATGTIEDAKELLVVAVARARNTGQKFSPGGAAMLTAGDGPILMEPVKAKISLGRAGTPQVLALDHDGKVTETKVAVVNGAFEIDGARDKTPYYLVRYP